MSCSRRGESGRRLRSRGALVALSLAAAAAPAAAQAEPVSPAVAEPVAESPASVRDYWTPRRMDRAEPAAVVLAPSGRIGGAPRRAPAAKPARGRPSRAAVDASAASGRFPERVHGKVFLTISGGSQPGDYICSATVVTSNVHTLAWTAGHCVHDAELGGGFASNWAFVPGFRDGERPFGTWPARKLFTTPGWSEDANIREDVGAAQLARDEQGRGIEDVIGARGIAFNRSRPRNVTALGYPALPNPLALPPRFDFDGQRLWSCASPITGSDSPPGRGPATMQIECDMTGGSSGGGWVTGGGLLAGLTSYGYTQDGNHLYGPYFGAAAERLYERAAGRRIFCARREVSNLGGPSADDFEGAGGSDVFKVAGAADRVAAAGGDDAACGGGGRDRLGGEAGRDVLRGGGGRDRLIGGRGRDTCVGGPGRDRARGCERTKRVP